MAEGWGVYCSAHNANGRMCCAEAWPKKKNNSASPLVLSPRTPFLFAEVCTVGVSQKGKSLLLRKGCAGMQGCADLPGWMDPVRRSCPLGGGVRSSLGWTLLFRFWRRWARLAAREAAQPKQGRVSASDRDRGLFSLVSGREREGSVG